MRIIINTDGGSRGNPGAAAIGVTAQDETQTIHYELAKYIGVTTNNEAEYQAVIASFEWLDQFISSHPEVTFVEWRLDSQLVVEQVNRNWKIKEPRLQAYAQKIWHYLDSFPLSFTVKHVRREFNKRADALVNQALDAQNATGD